MIQVEAREPQVADQRGVGKRLKRLLPARFFRALTVVYNAVAAVVPYGVKYPIGSALRRGKLPYAVIRDGDVVVQVGAPRDLLHAGRSRALHFTRMVGSGKTIVIEPDPENAAHFQAYVNKHHLESRTQLFAVGAWNRQTDLVYYTNPAHPASNVVEDVARLSEQEVAAAGYVKVTIKVDSLDNLLARANVPAPRLVSITTNGSEIPILEGMTRLLSEGLAYISVAPPRPELIPYIEKLGFSYAARDDRGYFFTRRDQQHRS
jgi:FkbM family methyltransferase